MLGRENSQVLLVADRKASRAARMLQRAGFEVVTTLTVDHAVAMCVNREFAAVVLDQELFVEVDGWSVAQSLKLVRRNICVVLVTRGVARNRRAPKGVDAQVAQKDLAQLPGVVRRFRYPCN